ncbi:MAG TPA: hypothetical protein P5137_04170 [Candidatus Brocadiia bacterium]|nr:hypothetical protein [Candidatus Brocadiia bacterium]
MSDAAVDILIRFQDKGSARLREIMDRLNQGGPVAARLGAAGAAALAAIERHGANAARVLGGLGTAAAAVGGKLNHALGLAVGRLVSLAKWLALAGAAFAGWQIGQGIRLNQQLEQSNVALTVLLRSQARANLLQRETLSFAARTPFRYEELDETVRMLEAFNMESSSWLSTVGDLAAGVGRPIQEVARALAYLSTGRTGEAAESLARMGVNLRAIRGLQWGGQGELLTPKDEAMRVVKGFLDERYGGMMERQSKTFAGAASTMMEQHRPAARRGHQAAFRAPARPAHPAQRGLGPAEPVPRSSAVHPGRARQPGQGAGIRGAAGPAVRHGI